MNTNTAVIASDSPRCAVTGLSKWHWGPTRRNGETAGAQWPWSSYPAVMEMIEALPWLDTDWLLVQFGKQRKQARQKYDQFIMQGKGLRSPLEATRHQLILGDDAFVEHFQQEEQPEQLREYSKLQRRVLALPLSEYEKQYKTRNEAMAVAYQSGAFTMREIAEYFGIHYMTVSRAVRQYENNKIG